MTKRLTLLLIAVFSWLFIGSLILFHQEHVLGKHTSAFEHLFIAPKTKDESSIGLKLIRAAQGNQYISAVSVIQPPAVSEYYALEGELLPVVPHIPAPDKDPLSIGGLRAPPLA